MKDKDKVIQDIKEKAEIIADSLNKGHDIEITHTDHGMVIKQISKKTIK